MSNNNYNVDITSETEAWKLQLAQSQHLIKSGAIPPSFNNAEQVLAVIQYGRELGYRPMTSLMNISLIKGKPTLSANLIGARLKLAGYKFKVIKYEDSEVRIKFIDLDGDPLEVSFTKEEVKKAGNADKDNYKKHDKEMLYARCLTRGGRIVAPEILHGIYAPEEFNKEDIETNINQFNSKKFHDNDGKGEITPIQEEVEEAELSAKLGDIEDSNKQIVPILLIEKIRAFKSMKFLKAFWEMNKQYHSEKVFIEAINAQKSIIEETELSEKKEEVKNEE